MRQGSDIDSSNVSGLLMFAPAVGAGLLMAFSRTLWAYATITEVYTLNALLVLLVFFLVLRWRRTIETRMDSSVAVATHDTWIYAAAFVFGLAMGVHHVTVALTLPAIAVVVYRTEGLKFFTSRRLLYAALISIGGLILVSQLSAVGSRALACNELGDPGRSRKFGGISLGGSIACSFLFLRRPWERSLLNFVEWPCMSLVMHGCL